MKKLYKNWAVHNFIAHPLMYLLSFFSKKYSKKLHDATLPSGETIGADA